ncbi:MAG: DNA methyltransferase [Bacillota bacterium]
MDHSLQSLMARTGSFPLSVPAEAIERLCKSKSIVFDPFCGKGTTLLAAKILGHEAYGMDVAPEAVICSLAKVVHVEPGDIEAYVSSLPDPQASIENVPDSVRVFFNDVTLGRVISVRDRLLSDMLSGEEAMRSKATFVLGCLLGILHGHSSFSLSLPCSHAYSMSPGYVAKYARDHGLQPPVRDVKACLLAKARRCLRDLIPEPTLYGVRSGSALECSSVFPELVGRVDVVITSPPYLNAQTYAKDNWLRMWLLNVDRRDGRSRYIETGSVTVYGRLMRTVFAQLSLMLRKGGYLVCVAGDVRRPARGDEEHVFRTGEYLAGLCADPEIGLEVIDTDSRAIPRARRYLNALCRSNGHRAHDLVERTFTAQKV